MHLTKDSHLMITPLYIIVVLYATPTPLGSPHKVSFQATLSLLKPTFHRHLYFAFSLLGVRQRNARQSLPYGPRHHLLAMEGFHSIPFISVHGLEPLGITLSSRRPEHIFNSAPEIGAPGWSRTNNRRLRVASFTS